ncbi:baseplate J/gp47 family protein [Gorillibacterium sp. sgz500922]|uniref:baseplate J/gp47 family protein n=1 Tax=Gorillibacterium sp. sgz500922 TaxID=3446694 RepID=UPI003F674400
MFEDQTYDAILERMLARVPDDVDKRQGSIIFDALAPAAKEVEQLFRALDDAFGMSSVLTASGDYLDLLIAEHGTYRQDATRAQREGIFYGANDVLIDVPIGSRFGIGLLSYVAITKLQTGHYILECEQEGEAGNELYGALLPLAFVPDLARAELTTVLIPGEDMESDDALRRRYLDARQNPGTSGNKADYRRWALDMPGVGAVQIFPLWAGAGTVKVVIVDADMLPASPALVAEVQTYIDPAPGQGEGQAPVGATVTVAAAKSKTINVSAKVLLASGYSLQGITDAFRARLAAWRKGVSFRSSYVSAAAIGALLLGTEGVLDHTGLQLNGGTANVALAVDEVPVIGTFALGV